MTGSHTTSRLVAASPPDKCVRASPGHRDPRVGEAWTLSHLVCRKDMRVTAGNMRVHCMGQTCYRTKHVLLHGSCVSLQNVYVTAWVMCETVRVTCLLHKHVLLHGPRVLLEGWVQWESWEPSFCLLLQYCFLTTPPTFRKWRIGPALWCTS